MHVARSLKELQDCLKSVNADQKKVGFVPTMGALHQGHVSLVNQAAEHCQVVVCSIFVNPTQFNDPKDFEKYPRNDAADMEALCQQKDVVIYFPKLEELYPSTEHKLLDYNDTKLFEIFEGKFRPGHFLGVVTVVMRLFAHVRPNVAFFGLKDYQQYLIIKRATPKFFKEIEIQGVPTVRNSKGLALSSRNQRLNAEQLLQAETISRVLQNIGKNQNKMEIDVLTKQGFETLQNAGFRTEYLAICNAENLEEIHNWNEAKNYVALCAAFVGEVRLIDNVMF